MGSRYAHAGHTARSHCADLPNPPHPPSRRLTLTGGAQDRGPSQTQPDRGPSLCAGCWHHHHPNTACSAPPTHPPAAVLHTPAGWASASTRLPGTARDRACGPDLAAQRPAQAPRTACAPSTVRRPLSSWAASCSGGSRSQTAPQATPCGGHRWSIIWVSTSGPHTPSSAASTAASPNEPTSGSVSSSDTSGPAATGHKRWGRR